MTASVATIRQWIHEILCFAHLCLKDSQRIESLIVEMLPDLPNGGALSLLDKRFLFFEELEKRLLLHWPEKQKPSLGQLELFEAIPYRQDLHRRESIQFLKAQAFLYLKWDRELMGSHRKLKEQSLPLGWVLEFASYLPSQNEIARDRAVLIAKYLLGELSDSEAIQVEKEFRFNPDWQKSKIGLEKVIEELKNGYRALDRSFFKEELKISKKTEDFLLEWFGIEQETAGSDEANESANVDADRTDSIQANLKPKPQSLSSVRVFVIVGVFATLVGYFGWLEKNAKPFKTPLISEVIPSVDEKQSIPLSSNPISPTPSIMAEEAANEVLDDRTINLIREMENKMKTDPLPDFNTSSQPDFENP